ncbi:MAG: CofH family radical SAM protein [Chitinophagaceae bacterium]|nr:CofH family radical SAM protein [Chitinophagaceae bacterium]
MLTPQTGLQEIINNCTDNDLKKIAQKVKNSERITEAECLVLFEKGELGYLGSLANFVAQKLHQNKVYFNRNFHIEPTNVCVFTCNFCSYSRVYKHRDEGWELSIEQMMDMVRKYDGIPVTEVHIVGGVHPKMNLEYFCELLRKIKAHRPDLHIKGFTAVELDYMFRKAKVSVEEGMKMMNEAGLQSLPGGGAEIFAAEIREKICADKVDGPGWLHIHETAHKLGMPTNATMLYGHHENYAHRVDHMSQLRNLQDKTKGFNCFIPLKYRSGDNDMSFLGEVSIIEDMRLYAIARIFMDNFKNLKAYWPMLGRQSAQLSLSFGVNDLDGTIDDTTKIYSMAGAEEQNPVMSTEDLCALILNCQKIPVERDTEYNEIKRYDIMDEPIVN